MIDWLCSFTYFLVQNKRKRERFVLDLWAVIAQSQAPIFAV
jgi:hypothetical protein